MVGLALYGAKTLSWDARIILSLGRRDWPKPVVLLFLPVTGVILYVMFVGTIASSASHRSHQPVAITILLFAILAFIQFSMIRLARDSESSGS